MSTQVQTTILIPAPLDQVWRALTDVDAYPQWNPLLRLRPHSHEGLREGGRALLTLRLGKLPLVVPVVVESASGNELRWVGGVPGLFRGRHYFRLREVEGGTELTHGEDFSGVLPRLSWSVLGPQFERRYRHLNDALARHCALVEPAKAW